MQSKLESKADESDLDDERARISYPAITLSQLKEAVLDGESIITELDMVNEVFTVAKSEIHADFEGNQPIPEFHYLLTLVMSYAESLLSYFIYPHKRLQSFLFDLCVDSRNFPTLQQLINFHVILDSAEFLDKLEPLSHLPWAKQTRLDTAKRMHKTDIVIQCLLAENRADEIIEYLRQSDHSFDIQKLIELVNDHDEVKKMILKQVELWNISTDPAKPVLSRGVIMSLDSP